MRRAISYRTIAKTTQFFGEDWSQEDTQSLFPSYDFNKRFVKGYKYYMINESQELLGFKVRKFILFSLIHEIVLF